MHSISYVESNDDDGDDDDNSDDDETSDEEGWTDERIKKGWRNRRKDIYAGAASRPMCKA